MDRQELRGNTFLALANFGDHVLHHLFPTLDHGILPQLYDIFFKTLLEFEAESQCYPWYEIIKGQFLQLARVETNPMDSHERYLLNLAKQKAEQWSAHKMMKREIFLPVKFRNWVIIMILNEKNNGNKINGRATAFLGYDFNEQ